MNVIGSGLDEPLRKQVFDTSLLIRRSRVLEKIQTPPSLEVIDDWIVSAGVGSMLVREDTPPIMRGKPSDEWYSPRHRYGVLPSAKLDELERDFGPALGDDPLVWPRVAPIAIAAAAVSSHRSYVVFRDDSGEILAIAPAGYAASGDALVRLSTLRGAP